MLLKIAYHSLKNRKAAALLTVVSILLSVSVLLSVEMLRKQAKNSFGRTISGVDLIVGARTGQTNLLLYSVFRIGNPSNNIQWSSVETLSELSSVKWFIPISLGDSHQGFRVVGTTDSYFAEFRYADKKPLDFELGQSFASPFETVIGADVAAQLNYQIGEEIVLAHGVGQTSFTQHRHSPFRIAGILQPTGTPVDKAVFVTLQGLEIAHMPASQVDETVKQFEQTGQVSVEIDSVSAVYLGLESKLQTFQLQRAINQYDKEPLMAILPGVVLTQLWQIVGNVESVLLVISILVVMSAMLGLATMLLASMRERRHEIAVLRTIGASPLTVFGLIQAEALILSGIASVFAVILVWILMTAASPWLSAHYGLFIEPKLISFDTLLVVGGVMIISFLIACVPAIKAYRDALTQGLTRR